MKKTCGDQNKPTQPPKPRNTNRGIRNPNTVEIRREKRSNKRRVARRQQRMEGEGDTTTETQRIPKAKAQEPLKLRMKHMLGKTTKFATLHIRGIKNLELEKK